MHPVKGEGILTWMICSKIIANIKQKQAKVMKLKNSKQSLFYMFLRVQK